MGYVPISLAYYLNKKIKNLQELSLVKCCPDKNATLTFVLSYSQSNISNLPESLLPRVGNGPIPEKYPLDFASKTQSLASPGL